MICPNCGKIDLNFPTPKITKKKSKIKLSNCSICSNEVWCIPTTKKYEKSQIETVKIGESREKILSSELTSFFKADSHHKTDNIDIDRYFVRDDKIVCYFEIKERSNTINAYKDTQFPYAKIDAGKKIIEKESLPVLIILKFADCWAYHKIDFKKKYRKCSVPFFPSYRSKQADKIRQIPVLLSVENDLKILSLRKYCL